VCSLLLVRDLTKYYLLFQKSHLSQLTGMEVYLKKDFLQYTGRYVNNNSLLSQFVSLIHKLSKN